jgi:type VI secretion system secreted protein VgrG
MADKTLVIEGRSQRISCYAVSAKYTLLSARIKEALGQITEFEAEFVTDKRGLDSQKFLKEPFEFEMDTVNGIRYWSGLCVECTFIGESFGSGGSGGMYAHYRVQLRSWPWMLTRTTDCQIFQELKTDDIIKQIFKDRGFSDYRFNLSGTPLTRNYCVQYRETDFDFVSRLMESEGMYYYFEYEKSKHTMVICDDSAKAEGFEGETKVPLLDMESGQREAIDFIYKWEEKKRFDTGTVTLLDYNFTTPETEVKGTRKAAKNPSKYERFDYPGIFEDSGGGTKVARRKIEAISAGNLRITGKGLVKNFAIGSKFDLKDHPVKEQNAEYLALTAVHILQMEEEYDRRADHGMDSKTIADTDEVFQSHQVTFVAQPSNIPFVPPENVVWPSISGVQTAVVVGPKGEEIYTDKYGRIKVQFHWDRLGKKDDKSSCWIRVATQMSGKSWGLIAIPRIGQEVVVQFEEGNPDRPIVTGMVYNGTNKVPMGLPANKTQLGFRSDTHKNEDGAAFHEFILEDDKDKEFIRMQSEKDYEVIVKNNTQISYGTGDKDEGHLKLDVWKETYETFGVGSGTGSVIQKIQDDFTKNLLKGNYTLGVDTGWRSVEIAQDDELTVGGDRIVEIKKDDKLTVDEDRIVKIIKDYKLTVDENREAEIKQDDKLTVDENREVEIKQDDKLEVKGKREIEIKKDYKLEVKGKHEVEITKDDKLEVKGKREVEIKKDDKLTVKGKLTLEADKMITFKCGKSMIVMTPSGIVISAGKVSIIGKTKIMVAAPMTTVKAKTMLTLKGAMVKIN